MNQGAGCFWACRQVVLGEQNPLHITHRCYGTLLLDPMQCAGSTATGVSLECRHM
ncbi:MAG: hypothetical protein NZ483_05310 [Verrucomicrobiae bacterium]|nr:hypothetical protein [Verrucomicrobiae bacterium]